MPKTPSAVDSFPAGTDASSFASLCVEPSAIKCVHQPAPLATISPTA